MAAPRTAQIKRDTAETKIALGLNLDGSGQAQLSTGGAFNSPLAEEFWRAAAGNALMNLHVLCHYGRNSHHIVEAIFKATARALRQAVEIDPRGAGVPSTKGVL